MVKSILMKHFFIVFKRHFYKILTAVLFFTAEALSLSFSQELENCSAIMPCPVLNTPDFISVFGGKDGLSVQLDEKGLLRALEFIALPGTTFTVLSRKKMGTHSILEVVTADYPSPKQLYIDSRFVTFHSFIPEPEARVLKSKKQIISFMRSLTGKPYMWGGNYAEGIPQMTDLYPPAAKVSPEILSVWQLKGVDCSGLIYQASGGYTPRNTLGMMDFGQGLKISGLSAAEISEKVSPLDLIVWPGHVVIVLDENSTIESSLSRGGVVISDLKSRINSIMSTRIPANVWKNGDRKVFVIRRWHTHDLTP